MQIKEIDIVQLSIDSLIEVNIFPEIGSPLKNQKLNFVKKELSLF